MTSFDPTAEQTEALRLFATGDDLVIEAGAGTGKTSTLRLIAEATGRRGQYMAFNRAIVNEAKAKMPSNIAADTIHALAARHTSSDMMARLRSGTRQRSSDVAKLIGVDRLVIDGTPAGRKSLAAGFLASTAIQGVKRFCMSADTEITPFHVPRIDAIDLPERWDNNRIVAEHLLIPMRRIWEDWNTPDGRLRYDHAAYLKAWELTAPQIAADFVLFDEAQDASPVMRSIVDAQRSAQRIWVGDSQQQIYSFTGAINALANVNGNRTFLTKSFRFGPEIAAVANRVLASLNAPVKIVGAGRPGTVGTAPQIDAYLARTNATVLTAAVSELSNGSISGVGGRGRPHIVGGVKELVAFVRGAASLIAKGWTPHPELTCFSSWDEVREYADMDPAGYELRLWVETIDEWGPDMLLEALTDTTTAEHATVVLSTAHKSKGCEWDRVRLAPDFPDKNDDEELRLLYVAATRARLHLDPSDHPRLVG